MTEPNPNEARTPTRPGFPTVLGLALLVGLVGSVLFSFHDSVRAVLTRPRFGLHLTYPEMLDFGLYAALRCALVGCGFMAAVGVCLALLILTRRSNLAGARLVGVAAGALVFFLVSVLLMVRDEDFATSAGSRAFTLIEGCALGLACAVGAAAGVRLLAGWLERACRLLALGLAVVAAGFALTNWGLWLYVAVLPNQSRMLLRLGELGIGVVTLGLGAGFYLLLAPPLAAARRRLAGAALVLVAGAVFGAMHWGLQAKPVHRVAPQPTAAASPSTRRPNVLWIVMDTCRADALSCYDCPRKTTPRLDAFAAEGTLYENAIVPSSWTLPSHAAMFTGALLSRTGTSAERQFLDESLATIAEVLRDHGYRTMGYSNNEYISRGHGLDRGFERLETVGWRSRWENHLLTEHFNPRLHLSDYGARETNRAVVRWIDRSLDDGQPFFLFINYMEAHGAWGCTPLFHRWLPADVDPETAVRLLDQDAMYAFATGGAELTPRQLDILRALYDGDVTYLDAEIGKLLDHLEARGILDHTLVIITSDHGELIGEHGLLGHWCSLHRDLIHVPLIIRYPPRFEADVQLKHTVEAIDIFPTILDALGIAWDGSSQLQGRSLLAPPPSEPRYAVSEIDMPIHVANSLAASHHQGDTGRWLRRLKSIQSADYKYIWASDGRDELYDLRADPDEERNLIGRLPDKARELRRRLEERIGRSLRRPNEPLDAARP